MTHAFLASFASRRIKPLAGVAAAAILATLVQPHVSLAPPAVASTSSPATTPARSAPVAGLAAPVDPTRGVMTHGPQLSRAMEAVVQVLVETPRSSGPEPRGRGAPMFDAPGPRSGAEGMFGPDFSAGNGVQGRGGGEGRGPNVTSPRSGPDGSANPRDAGPPRSGARPSSQPQFNGAGSGVIYDSGRGLILTNHHVVDGATRVVVRLGDGREVAATLVGSDAATDIAVLRVEAGGLPTAVAEGPSDTVQVGDLAFAIGYPMGLERTLTMGIISGLNRSGIGDGVEDFIQTDASINRGNSGGPLVDSQGRLIGINTAIFSPTGGNIGIGFAVPTRIALSVARQIERSGRVERGRIGVSIAPVTQEVATRARLETPQGALIDAVEPGSPAARAGIAPGDIVVSAGERAIINPRMLHAAVATTAQGERLSIGLIRAGRRIDLAVQVQGAGTQRLVSSTHTPGR